MQIEKLRNKLEKIGPGEQTLDMEDNERVKSIINQLKSEINGTDQFHIRMSKDHMINIHRKAS